MFYDFFLGKKIKILKIKLKKKYLNEAHWDAKHMLHI